MSTEIETSTIMVDLDVILDTRLATIFSIDESKLEAVMEDGYHDRLQDIFTGIDRSIYESTYLNRDKQILQHALLTPIVSMISEFVEKTNKLLITTPIHRRPKVDINIYPYELNDEEANNIIAALRHHTGDKADIAIVNYNYESLSPKYLKDNISIYVTYNYIDWLETHAANGNLKTTTCPEVTMFGPAIYFKDSETPTSNPFKAMETINGIFISLKLLPIEFFSVVRPKS